LCFAVRHRALQGDVRLFSEKRSLLSSTDADKRKPRATTTLPGFGCARARVFCLTARGRSDAVTSIDVTEDGAWVLATCKTYLVVIPTTIDESTGFETRMGV
jgi:hypothetical protein